MNKYQALKDALKAGPTDGPWELVKHEYPAGDCNASVHANVYPEKTRSRSICGQKSNRINGRTNQRVTDLAYIAAANPTTISALLADLEAAEKALNDIEVTTYDAITASMARVAIEKIKGQA